MSTTSDSTPASGASPGPSIDRWGRDVADPTPNVLDLVEARERRQDDLRHAFEDHMREVGQLREAHAQEMRLTARRYEDRLDVKNEQIRQAETARIDAIRAVDVGAVSRAAEVSAAQASTLATQQQASADALRNQVEQARIATADALAQALAPITKSIEDLRAAQYQQQGEKSSKVESSTSDRDAVALESARIQAQSARNQQWALVISALFLAIAIYAAFHH